MIYPSSASETEVISSGNVTENKMKNGDNFKVPAAFQSPKTRRIVNWIQHEADEGVSNVLPTTRGTNHLRFSNYKVAYNEFSSAEKDAGFNPPCYQHFVNVWARTPTLNNIKLERKTGTLSKCNKCMLYKRSLKNISPHAETDRKAIYDKYRGHICWALLEKKAYYERRYMAILHRKEYLSIIVDGSTQRVHRLPRFGFYAKQCEQEFLPQSILAVLVHGHATFLYPRSPWMKSGSSFTIQCLTDALNILSSQDEYKDSGLPKDMFIQMDNCSGDNKNKYMFSWGATLVQRGVFKSISFSFLLVGHTHEDIDALFSRISGHLARKPIFTTQEFDNLIAEALIKTQKLATGSRKHSFTKNEMKNVIVKRFQGTADFKRVLGDCVDKKISGLKVPCHFFIYADTDASGNRVARLKYRFKVYFNDFEID